MRLYDPNDITDKNYIEVPASKEDNEELIKIKYKKEAERIKKELDSKDSDN